MHIIAFPISRTPFQAHKWFSHQQFCPHSIKLSPFLISLAQISMLTQFMHTLLKNSILVGSLAPSLKKNSSARSGFFDHYHYRWPQKKVHPVSPPNTEFVDIYHTWGKLEPPSTTKLIQMITPHVGGKPLMSQKSYVPLTSHNLSLWFALHSVLLGYLPHFSSMCSLLHPLISLHMPLISLYMPLILQYMLLISISWTISSWQPWQPEHWKTLACLGQE